MTSPIPGAIAAPVIVFVIAVTVGRWILLHESMTDRLLNRSLAWGAAALILLENEIAPRYGSLMHQLAMGCIVLAVIGLYGTAQLWSGADPRTARLRQRGYDIVAVAAVVVILIVGTSARQEGRLLGAVPDWQSAVVGIAMCLPAIACGRLVWRAGIREFRASRTVHERLVYGGLFAPIIVGSAGLPFSAALLNGQMRIDDPNLVRWAAPNYGAVFLISVVLAVPLVELLAVRAGWDRSKRYCRRLQPLWSDVTAAVPEIVLHPAGGQGEPDVRLIRMTVEIRDALLHLNRYVPTEVVIPRDISANRQYAMRIAHGLRAKVNGRGPTRTVRQARGSTPVSRDFESELRQLLALARVWSRARAAVDAQHADTEKITRPGFSNPGRVVATLRYASRIRP
ncbi:MAB_1171c family putative transporter [Nocardia sp. NPDC050710]|uniref:MAB_1171c family putative transporter n=1 Tax=Nocardia sp. NPDC050710 TaxID=3157220 RepID=UPI0033C3FBB7